MKVATSRIPGLDGLRAIAVILVVMEHSLPGIGNLPAALDPGAIGVRLFFVLSGFLITGILLDSRREAEAVHASWTSVWIAFYVRRTLRIFPLGYVALALAWIAAVPAMREYPVWFLTYTSNILWVLLDHDLAAIGHFWTLAVEEQFYLVWPLVVLLVPWRRLSLAIGLSIAGAILFRAVAVTMDQGLAAFALTPGRFDAFALGGLLALVRLNGGHVPLKWLIGPGVLLFVAGMGGGFDDLEFAVLTETGSVLLSGAAILAAGSGKPWTRPLNWRPVAYVGTISYGIYVWHLPLPMFLYFTSLTLGVDIPFPAEPGLGRFLALSAGSIALATVSWRLFEKPINDLKRFAPYVSPHRAAPTTPPASGRR